MPELTFDNITYSFNPDDKYKTQDGKVYKFVSIKKVSTYKGKKKFQTITIKHENWNEFRRWLLEEIVQEEGEIEAF
jgi:hypothetical protein